MRPRLISISALVLSLVAMLFVGQTPAWAGSCTRADERHTDYAGSTWKAAWYCGNDGGTAVYADAASGAVVGYRGSTNSWFVCYRRGEKHSGGNNVWYYAQGDRGHTGSKGWGYVPAGNVYTSTDPWPGMPECPYSPEPASRIAITAGLGRCPAGYLCAWDDADYQGKGVGFFDTESSWANTGDTGFLDNKADSFYNNGFAGSVGDIRLFDAPGWTGRSITLCNRESIAHLPTAEQARYTWIDTMSSHQWGSYC